MVDVETSVDLSGFDVPALFVERCRPLSAPSSFLSLTLHLINMRQVYAVDDDADDADPDKLSMKSNWKLEGKECELKGTVESVQIEEGNERGSTLCIFMLAYDEEIKNPEAKTLPALTLTDLQQTVEIGENKIKVAGKSRSISWGSIEKLTGSGTLEKLEEKVGGKVELKKKYTVPLDSSTSPPLARCLPLSVISLIHCFPSTYTPAVCQLREG